MILAPIAAFLIQMWVSRTREYAADASAAQLTKNPYALATALEKISGTSRRVPLAADSSTAHMFIIAPFLGGMGNLFSTHPPVQKRIEKLIGRPSVYGSLE
jgi:heat shock protein HtpX